MSVSWCIIHLHIIIYYTAYDFIIVLGHILAWGSLVVSQTYLLTHILWEHMSVWNVHKFQHAEMTETQKKERDFAVTSRCNSPNSFWMFSVFFSAPLVHILRKLTCSDRPYCWWIAHRFVGWSSWSHGFPCLILVITLHPGFLHMFVTQQGGPQF